MTTETELPPLPEPNEPQALLRGAKAALEDYNPEWAKTVASAIDTYLAGCVEETEWTPITELVECSECGTVMHKDDWPAKEVTTETELPPVK